MAWFEPYSPLSATRWLRAALVVFAAVPLLSTPWSHPTPAVVVVPVLMSLLCASAAAATLRGWHPGPAAWACSLLASTALIVVADLVTRDAAATGLVVFLVPTVLAAALVERRGAWATTTAAATGSLIVCIQLLPTLHHALTTWFTVSAVLALLTALLTRSAHHNHHLTAELRHQAAVDSLTGLVTRRVLDGALSAALRGAAAARGNGLLIVDLDHFKKVNDTYGHLIGDRALKHCGAVLVQVVGPGAVVSRLGGDELAALVPGASYDQIADLAHAVAHAMRDNPLQVAPEENVTLTVSVGAAHSPSNASDSEDLYRQADRALYAAKAAGRDQAHIAGRTSAVTTDAGWLAPLS